jgi:hypothetical protein
MADVLLAGGRTGCPSTSSTATSDGRRFTKMGVHTFLISI